MPTCGHPGRKHYGKDKCAACYMSQWIKEHPDANSAGTWIARHPEQAAAYKRRYGMKRHGLTVEDYAEMWQAQGGKCANARCSFEAAVSMPDHRRGLQVDHDHATGRIRGLLCPSCNLALGCVGDDRGRLLGLIEFLANS